MDGAKLSEAVWISPGFNTAVTLETDLDNEKKVRAYIPTRAACEVLLDLEKQLHPMVEGPRSRVITGTYGTGKSHLGRFSHRYDKGIFRQYAVTVYTVDSIKYIRRNIGPF